MNYHTCPVLGGHYNHLWLDDWAAVQDPYRHPTGYDLWRIIREHDSDAVTLPDMLTELGTRFVVLTPAYVAMLSELWRSGRLFSSSNDICRAEKDNMPAYYYKGRPRMKPKALVPLAATSTQI